MPIRQFFSSNACFLMGLLLIVNVAFNLRDVPLQRLYNLDDNYASYLADYNSATAIDPNAARGALKFYTLLNKIFPQLARTNEMKGLCHVLLKDDAHAVEDFNKAIKARPTYYWINVEKAMALYRLKQTQAALAIFENINKTPEQELFNAGMLPSIGLLAPPQQLILLEQLKDFVVRIKNLSKQMTLLCLAQEGKLNNAPTVNIPTGLYAVHPWTIFFPTAKEHFID